MVDYSRFDGLVDSEDEDAPREEQPVRPQRGPSQLPSPSSGGGAPTDIMDDLNDYFSRLEARRQEQIEAGQPPPSVDRFTQSELETLPTFTFNASETQYEECSVCLNDFAPGEVLLKLPARHGSGADAPRKQNDPATHAEHAVRPLSFMKLPASHWLHEPWPSKSCTVPGLHSV